MFDKISKLVLKLMTDEIMRKFFMMVSITLAFGFGNSNIWACSCLGISNFSEASKYASYIVKGKVIGTGEFDSSETLMGYKYAEFLIESYFKGEMLSDTIKIAMSTGYECYTARFEVGQIYYVNGSLETVYQMKNNFPEKTIDKIIIPSECSIGYLKLEDEEICGKISIGRNKISDWFNIKLGRLKKIKRYDNVLYVECMSMSELENKLMTSYNK